MKLHDLKPAAGSRRPRTRVGRGIAAGQGKTAGRGTKGQKARAGASIPGWFEGGQTPIHIRVPKLRGFKNAFKITYAVVNVGQISAYAEAGRFGVEAEQPKAKRAGKAGDQPVATINAETLAQAGLIRGDDKPLKVLGQAPDFAGHGRWFNTAGDRPLTLAALRGRVVLTTVELPEELLEVAAEHAAAADAGLAEPRLVEAPPHTMPAAL